VRWPAGMEIGVCRGYTLKWEGDQLSKGARSEHYTGGDGGGDGIGQDFETKPSRGSPHREPSGALPLSRIMNYTRVYELQRAAVVVGGSGVAAALKGWGRRRHCEDIVTLGSSEYLLRAHDLQWLGDTSATIRCITRARGHTGRRGADLLSTPCPQCAQGKRTARRQNSPLSSLSISHTAT
jgi:hypothetical protein